MPPGYDGRIAYRFKMRIRIAKMNSEERAAYKAKVRSQKLKYGKTLNLNIKQETSFKIEPFESSGIILNPF